MSRLLKYLWASPVTIVGLAFAVAAAVSGGHVQIRDGIIEAYGGWLHSWMRGGRLFRGGAAMTLGHVILARDRDCLERSRLHEQVHVHQFERYGPLLPPIYVAIAWWLAWRGYDPHLDHPFEQEAYQRDDCA